jgi:hypothetical protein
MLTLFGPVNYCKLEGEFNGVSKTIHCFCDKHILTQLDNSNGVSFESFLNKHFINTQDTKQWDFLVEANSLGKLQETDKDLQITKIRNYAHEIKKDNVFPNLRIHHTDVRWILSKYLGIDYVLDQVRSGSLEEKIKLNGISSMSNYFATTSARIRNVISILREENFVPKYDYEEIVLQILTKLVKKIKRCQDEKLTSVINNMLNENLLKLDELSNDMLNVKSFSDCLKFVTNLHTYTAFLMDIYLLRRILDKEYMQNIILYAGSYHVYSLAMTLQNYFDFKLKVICKNPFELTNSQNVLDLLIATPKIKEQFIEFDESWIL